MVFAYSSAILIVQYPDPWPNNHTQLNQINFGLCVTDILSRLVGFIIAYWYCLPFNSLFINVLEVLGSVLVLAYSSVSIYIYKQGISIDNDFYNACIALIVCGSIEIMFLITYKCFGVKHCLDPYLDESVSVTSSEFYSIRDILGDCCYDCRDCCDCYEHAESVLKKHIKNSKKTKESPNNPSIFEPRLETIPTEIPTAIPIEVPEAIPEGKKMDLV